MQRSKLPYFFLALAAMLAVSALILLIVRPGVKPEPLPEHRAVPEKNIQPESAKVPQETIVVPRTPEVVPDKAADRGTTAATPEQLVDQVAKSLETGDIAALSKIIGEKALDPQTAERLKALSASPLRFRQPGGINEVGEIELNARTRWSLQIDGAEPGHDRIFLDLKRDGATWSVEKIILPPPPGEPAPKAILADSLGVADAFLQSVLSQDFESARAFVDPATVSDTKIAGLCILFEEGGYHMRKSKPLRSMFQRADTVGYLANVETLQGRESAQFALTLRRPSEAANWRVSEINLSQLLTEYARRVAGGDVYYSPLVKNPSGGDTLALYFDFDEDEMNPRARRQLEIVSMILKADPGKKITLSGHTDSLGTDQYNNSLSARRAQVVRDFLDKAGVSAAQIITVAKGASQPRRPNVTESGQDNPEGRRANRRTEIYLDF
jgi:outer membrane protein OmpA-like peptidoglycan-associated protein